MIPKRTIIGLSVLSFTSSLAISALALLLVAVDGPFNIIESPIQGMRLAAAAVIAQNILSTLIQHFHLKGHVVYDKEKNSSMTAVSFVKSGLFLFTASLLFHITAVCFGAPFLSSTDATYSFAVLLTVLTCLPCCLVAGPNLDAWLMIFASFGDIGAETVVHLTSVCSLLGAWLGAIPIPLDWDRPWQEWPRSCAIGALAGYAIGQFVAAVYLPRRYRAISKAKFT